jgi:hypothetical protein
MKFRGLFVTSISHVAQDDGVMREDSCHVLETLKHHVNPENVVDKVGMRLEGSTADSSSS